MPKIAIKYLVVSLILAMTALLVNSLKHDSSTDESAPTRTIEKIPMQIGSWHGEELPLEEKVYKILETRSIIHRNYTDGNGNSVLLSIVYYQDTKVDFHAPESCLGGRGEKVRKSIRNIDINAVNEINKLEIAEIVSTSQRGKSLSFYFYKAGSFLGQNYIKMRLFIAKNRIFNKNSSGSLIRISSLDFSSDEIGTRAILNNFLQETIKYIVDL